MSVLQSAIAYFITSCNGHLYYKVQTTVITKWDNSPFYSCVLKYLAYE